MCYYSVSRNCLTCIHGYGDPADCKIPYLIESPKILFNISNHKSESWTEKQKAEFDIIIDIPFPNVSPTADTSDVIDVAYNVVKELNKKLKETDDIRKNSITVIYIAGEFTLSYLLYEYIRVNTTAFIAIPTTERRTVEEMLPDGSIRKTSIFEFVRWRYIVP